jgi:hypothetical protein
MSAVLTGTNEDQITLTAGGTIVQGDLVSISAARTVVATTTSTKQPIGVAISGAANGEQVTIKFLDRNKTHRVRIASSITANTDLGLSATAGIAAAYSTGYRLGCALESGASGDFLLFYAY